MGIINVTPDSFYEGSRFSGTDAVLSQAEAMISEGATLLDIGGQSTRPGSVQVSVEEELARVIGPVRAVSERFPAAFISIDTFYGRVAAEAVAAGACMVNDISAGSLDETLVGIVAQLGVPYVLMHMQGNPSSMQQAPRYTDVTVEVLDFLVRKKAWLHSQGIRDIILDPGFGFGKTRAHNFTLLRNLRALQFAGSPLLAGLSRKGMVYTSLGISPAEGLNGTTVLNSFALMGGANMLRVHDVKPAMEAIRLYELLQGHA
jgi:dihydropteroate synthase